jgi:hypothetical protein
MGKKGKMLTWAGPAGEALWAERISLPQWAGVRNYGLDCSEGARFALQIQTHRKICGPEFRWAYFQGLLYLGSINNVYIDVNKALNYKKKYSSVRKM